MASVWDPRNWPAMAAEAYDNQNPEYHISKAELKKAAIQLQVISGAGAVVGAVALFFGMTKGIITLIFIGSPIVYLAYNVYRISENIQEMSENFNQFLQNPLASKFTGNPRPDLVKIEASLKKNTFCFGMFISYAISHVKTKTGW